MLNSTAGFQALPDMFKAPHYAANDVVATVLAYRTDKVKSAPKSWADFWDVRGRPGQRAMRRFPFDTIEQALLADGVVRWTDSMAMHWPLNAVLAILGAPVVLAVLWKRTHDWS